MEYGQLNRYRHTPKGRTTVKLIGNECVSTGGGMVAATKASAADTQRGTIAL